MNISFHSEIAKAFSDYNIFLPFSALTAAMKSGGSAHYTSVLGLVVLGHQV
jgi:hypothetical protein